MWNSIKQLISICKNQKSSYVAAIILSFLSVLSGTFAYYGIYLIMDRTIRGSHAISVPLGLVCAGFIGKYLFFSFASMGSHHATANLLIGLS